MEINLPDLPDTDYILVPPKTIFYPPIVEEPYLDPLLLPSLEQVERVWEVRNLLLKKKKHLQRRKR